MTTGPLAAVHPVLALGDPLFAHGVHWVELLIVLVKVCLLYTSIFDIEIVFLYPWAVIYGQLRTFGLVEVLVFAVVVFASFLYLVSNGALDWGPAKRLRPALSDQRRTTQSTIARVGPEAGPPTGRAA